VEPAPAAPVNDLPPLPPPRIQRAVDCALADLQLWLAAGRVAMDLYQHRNPHALLSWTRMARYLDLAFDLKKMVLGLDSPNPLPEKITYDYELTGLKRSYGHLLDPAPPVAAAVSEAGGAIATGAAAGSAICLPSSCPAQPPATILPPAPPGASPEGPRRCDAWSRWARQVRQQSG